MRERIREREEGGKKREKEKGLCCQLYLKMAKIKNETRVKISISIGRRVEPLL